MALALLDGTMAATAFTTGATPVAWTNVASYVSADMGNEMFEQTTFGNSGWRQRIRGLKQIVGRIAGFLSTGLAISDPMALFASSGATAFVMTFHTLCTLTGSLQPRNYHAGMQAAGNSEMGLDFESYGPVTSAWVTS
jgi:hypothetical protein